MEQCTLNEIENSLNSMWKDLLHTFNDADEFKLWLYTDEYGNMNKPRKEFLYEAYWIMSQDIRSQGEKRLLDVLLNEINSN